MSEFTQKEEEAMIHENRTRFGLSAVVTLGATFLVALAGNGALATTVNFQEGSGGYTGTQDTFLQQNPANASTNNGNATLIGWDGDDPSGTGNDIYTLLRFDNIIGGGANQVPAGAQITEALLFLTIVDTGDTGQVHPLTTSWTESSTFSSFCGASCDEGVEYGSMVTTFPASSTGTFSVNVTASVQAWADGTTNLGWIIRPHPDNGSGGVDANSSEFGTASQRPRLQVRYNEGPPAGGSLVRQPYLQMGTPTSMTICWRSDLPSDSRVRYGTTQGNLNLTATNATSSVNHVVTINGLTPATRYYYDVGSTTAAQGGGTASHYFETSPVTGSSTPFNFWAVGDGGAGSTAQVNVMNAMLAAAGANPPDFALYLGDMAYTSGTDAEFTSNYFTPYASLLQRLVVWPTLGNHEGASTTSGQPGASSGPYYEAYVLPTAGQAGGVASGTEAYHSFDYANVHFINLNSYQVNRSATGPMANWLISDLSATSQPWIIAYWHHPPYSRGTHNSDTEVELREMRENILPILEAAGVDLVLSGHSHGYERSYLIDGTYSTPTPNFATLSATGKILDDGNGRLTGDGAYFKPSGINPHEGTVYVVAGHGGASTGGTGGHPVMFMFETTFGSCLIDVNGNTLTLRNVRVDNVISDNFTIQKGDPPPRVIAEVPGKNDVVSNLPSVQVVFSVPVSGVDASDLTVNGSPATNLTGSGAGPYTFSGYSAPGPGTASVTMAAGGIASISNPTLLFEGHSWSYTIDPSPPVIASITPARDAQISVLPQISIEFSKQVFGVVAGNLTVNGSPATSVVGVSGSTGPFTFSGFSAPPEGLVSVALASGAIQDDVGQPFAGDNWEYGLQVKLIINEFLASNNTAVTDEFGEFDDYLEIYNPGNAPIDMGGMYLTDSLGFPAQHQIPAGVVIGAHSYLVFWCDSQPSQGPLHVSFNILRTGEDLGLFDTAANGFALIDGFTFPTQTTDVASGRFPDGTAGFVSMAPTPGAPNVINCNGDGECSALNGPCTLGRCIAGECEAEAVSGSCNDGVACTSGDTCIAGICSGTDNCTGGQVCNLVTGQCHTMPAPPLPILPGSQWRYFKGTGEPTPGNLTAWTQTSFDDSGWLQGAGGFGYGTDCDPYGTVLSDMMNGYRSLYIRRKFNITDPNAVLQLNLTMDYDDGYVAYINGTRVSGDNLAGNPPAFNQLATADHECSQGSPANPPTVVPIHSSFTLSTLLQAGDNVLAIQAHNLTDNSSDFTLIAQLDAVIANCTTPADCSDGNLCTNDVCSAGICSNPPVTCPVGQSCNPGTGGCVSAPITVTFQQGVGGYTGAKDTFLNSGAATANNAAATTLVVDQAPTVQQTLMEFGGIFGNGVGQIPPGATIQSASLTINVTNASAAGALLHRMLQAWNDTDNWNTFATGGAGIQAGVEAAATADVTSLLNSTGTHTFSVLSSIQTWHASPSSNFGWAWLPPAQDDSWQFSSSEATTVANRPLLSVTYLAGCLTAADCDDSNVCTADACEAGTCTNTPIPNCCVVSADCNDGNVCTTDTCTSNTCSYTNNTAACSDGNACTSNDQCAGGACVSGPAVNCDDANVCTTDSCNPASGCQYSNNANSCNDGLACTINDTCSGGVCTGTANCPVGQFCHSGTGQCETAATLTFQNGLNGYTGTEDTYIQSASPTANNGASESIRWDSSDGSPAGPVYLLLRFDGVFGNNPGQIPPGSTISLAELSYTVGGDANAPGDPGDLREAFVSWTEAENFNSFGGDAGVQSDEHSSPSLATLTGTPIGTYTVNVTSSLQGWSNNPANNRGWIVLPTNTNGVQVRSSEYVATPSERPRLTITWQPAGTPCTTPGDCDDSNPCTTDSCVSNFCSYANNSLSCNDGNACTTNDQCSGGTCVGGPALNCNDGNVCTDDSCNAITGCQQASNTAPCDDGVACTTGDVCSGGVCGGTANCPGGQICNMTSGQCEAPPADMQMSCSLSSSFAQPGSSVDLDVFLRNMGSAPAVRGYQTRIAITRTSGTGTVSVGCPCPCPPANHSDGGVEIDSSRPDYLFLGVPNTFFSVNCINLSATTSRLNGATTVTTVPKYLSNYVLDVSLDATPGSTFEIQILPSPNSLLTDINGGPLPGGIPFDASAPCELTIGAPTSVVDIELIPLSLASPTDTSPLLPTAQPNIRVGEAFVVEVWAQTVRPNGFGSVSADLTYNGSRTPVTNIVHTSTFNTFPSGSFNNGLGVINDLSGSHPVVVPPCSDLVGAQPSWARVAILQMNASTLGSSLIASGPTGNPIYGTATCGTVGDVDPADISYGSVLVNVVSCLVAADCNDGNPCTTDNCVANVCQNVNNTNPCNDNNACTTNDACSSGACVGGPALVCDDFNVCTTDTCNPSSGCIFTNNSNPCSDGNACTTNDTCAGGVCVGGAAPNCNDGNLCTTDTCIPATGCSNTNNSLPCNDGSACTTNDTCAGGVCVGGAAPNCNDGNVCTTDTCNPASGCVNTNNTNPCNDNNACTTADTCSGGVCVGGPALNCNDNNVCTNDSCNPASGCVNTNNSNSCSDGSVCTVGDTCAGGVCVGGAPLVCNDNNICTNDSCHPVNGCIFNGTGVTVPCDDGSACTENDVCQGTPSGVCAGTPIPDCTECSTHPDCDDGNLCNGSDTCVDGVCVQGPPLNCNDGNVCTDDSCVPASGCVNTHNSAPCNDDDACTTNDTCSGGVCVGGAPLVCDDGNVCTNDTCHPSSGCASTNNSNPCDDGNACTTNDTCAGGVCVGGAPPNCNDSNPCTADGCNPPGGCVNAPVPDGTDCDDGLFCNGGHSCLGGVCVPDAPDCTHACEFCDESADECSWCVFDLNFNTVIDGFDFAFFAGCFGACYASSDPCAVASFDGDPSHCVGGTDFGAFSGCFGESCGTCPTCSGGQGAFRDGQVASTESVPVAVRLVVTTRTGGPDMTDRLPASARSVSAEGRFLVEIWVSRGGPAAAPAPGLAAVFADLNFDPNKLAVQDVQPSRLFSTLAGGEKDNGAGKVWSVGGCAPLGDGSVGVTAAWVKLATVSMQALEAGDIHLSTSAAEQPLGISLFGRFDEVDPTMIDFGSEVVHVRTKSQPDRLPRGGTSAE